MFKEGLLEEMRSLLKLKLSQTAQRIIAVREIQGYWEGNYDLERAKDLIKRNTRHYAKRQLTWFRKEKRLVWIMMGEKETAAEIASKIFGLLNQRQRAPEKSRLAQGVL